MNQQTTSFIDSDTLTTWVRWLLYAQILVAVISMFSGYMEYQLLSDFENGVYSSQERAMAAGEASDQRQQLIALVYLAIFILSAIVILKWIYRAGHNARAIGAEGMKISPGWAVGWYFIPIATLWKPYQAMKEIWQASHSPTDWEKRDSGPFLAIWWVLWIVSNGLGQALFRMSMRAEEISELKNLNLWYQASEVISILLALIFLQIVNSIYIAQMQHAKSDS